MRNRNPYPLMMLALILGSLGASAKQVSASDDKQNHAQPEAMKTAPKEQVENWGVPDDLKTGIDLRPPFVVQREEQPDFVREIVRVQWRNADPIDLWIMRPKASGKVPVILYLYSYPGDPIQFRDNGWSKRATNDGFAAVGFVSALTGQRYYFRPMKQWFISELPEALGATAHDVQLILNYLAERGDMDVDHVGMFGMGSGASIAILAAQADSRIKALDLLDPWGDWPDWLRDSPSVPDAERSKFTTPEFLKSVATLDPIAYLPSMKTQTIRIQQTTTEKITPKSAKDKIAGAVADPAELVKYTGVEDLMKSWQANGLSGWIKQQLRAQMPPEAHTGGLAALDADVPRN